MTPLLQKRQQMVETQIEKRGIHDPLVLQALREVPREKFLPAYLEERAYEDTALGIEEGQTISQPYIVALMSASLQLHPEDRVLEVGTGSGYGAAILSRIVSHVYTIEYFPFLAEQAKKRFEALHYTNISCLQKDGSLGWPEKAPFDAISVTAAAKEVPQALFEQLKVGGRLVIPLQDTPFNEELILFVKKGEGHYQRTSLGMVRFVPLL